MLDLDGEPGFGNLSRQVLGRVQKHVLGELLGQRGGALDAPALGDVDQQGAGDAFGVHAVVVVEVRVFHGDDRLLHELGDVVERNHHAVLLAMDVGEEVALAIVDLGRLVRDVAVQRADVGQLREAGAQPGRTAQHPEDRHGRHEEQHAARHRVDAVALGRTGRGLGHAARRTRLNRRGGGGRAPPRRRH
ncbi:hypothetical protein D3C72_1250960 [compost metagenome]